MQGQDVLLPGHMKQTDWKIFSCLFCFVLFSFFFFWLDFFLLKLGRSEHFRKICFFDVLSFKNANIKRHILCEKCVIFCNFTNGETRDVITVLSVRLCSICNLISLRTAIPTGHNTGCYCQECKHLSLFAVTLTDFLLNLPREFVNR